MARASLIMEGSSKVDVERIGTSQSGRPILRFRRGGPDRVIDAAGLIVVFAGFVIVLAAWQFLPESVPVHFDMWGRPDGWGERWVLLIVPVVAAVLHIGLGLARHYPHVFNYLTPITEAKAVQQYAIVLSMLRWVRLEAAILLTGLTFLMVAIAMGKADGIGVWWVISWLAVFLGTVTLHIVWQWRTK